MAKKKKYIVTRGNFTLKRKHKVLNGDNTIYERDYRIINNTEPWNKNAIPAGTSTFKMVRYVTANSNKKHNYGDWLKQDVCLNNNNGEIWTLNCVNNTEIPSSENKVKIKPNFNSLLDFAYFGSCEELIKTSVKKIINTFPAEMYFTNDIAYYYDSQGNQVLLKDENGKQLYHIDNLFGIDVTNDKNKEVGVSDLRYLNLSYFKYNILDENNEYVNCINGYQVDKITNARCGKDGDCLFRVTLLNSDENNEDIFIYCYLINGEKTLVSSHHSIRLRPIKEEIEKFFLELSDFEKIMLNRDTNPLYTMDLDYSHETDYGIETYRKKFTWGTVRGWNLDINSSLYEDYIVSLLELCDFYDQRRTNNLWRSMTHDSIKNMDLSFKKNNLNEEDEDYSLATTKLENLFMIYGRQFDELKRYIDNIKSFNIITYDNNNNIPDYFLSDKLEISGWEVRNTAPTLDESIKVDSLFPGYTKSYASSDANITLMKNLCLNNKNILSRKGTRHGIEMVLSLFGLKSYDFAKKEYEMHNKGEKWDEIDNSSLYDYKLDEYVNIVNDFDGVNVYDVSEKMPVAKYNQWKSTIVDTEDGEINEIEGLPLREVLYVNENNEVKKYVIPWYSNFQKIDGDPYYQMYGGWGKLPKKVVTYNGESKIILNEGNLIYEESVKQINSVKNINDLKNIPLEKIKTDSICYVHDLAPFVYLYNNDKNGTPITSEGYGGELTASHYFILKNVSNKNIIGTMYYDNENSGETKQVGWLNVPIEDIEKGINDGAKVLYLESIIDDKKGNNPHMGNKDYDDGTEYLKYYKNIFKGAIDNNLFRDIAYDCENGELNKDIQELGFKGIFDENGDVINYKDNVKTWYFSNTNNYETNLLVLEKKQDNTVGSSWFNGIKYDGVSQRKEKYSAISEQGHPEVGKTSEYTFFESDIEPHNFESGATYDEAAANSIINNKKMTIEFSWHLSKDYNFYNYLINSILPYLKQVIPSTCIFEIKLNGGSAEYADMNVATIDGITEKK